MKYKESTALCWKCAKCTGKCNWSREFEPVAGWTVEKTIGADKKEHITVLACPEFAQEDRKNKVWCENMDYEGCMQMVYKVLEFARQDYITTDKQKTIHEIESFIRGKGASRVHLISDPERVIRKLRNDRKEYKIRKAQLAMVK